MPDDKRTRDMIQLDRSHLWHHIVQHKIFEEQDPFIAVSGKGCMVKDIHGNEYIDGLSGGVWVVNAGYGREELAKACYEQLMQIPYYAMSAGNIPSLLLADKLSQLMPHLKRSYYANSGSEANETAFKMVRQYFRLRYPAIDKNLIVFRYRDYHGTTFGALSATGQSERRVGYGPMVPGFRAIPPAYCYRCYFGKEAHNCDLDCARSLEHLIEYEGADSIAAIIVEPITAGGGIIVPHDDYFKILFEICRKYEILVIMDEVVNGFGRTGRMFGHQHWDVKPDMVTMAKGITSGYAPLGVTSVTEEIFNAFLNDPSDKIGYLRHINTFGGCAASAAVALKNIEIIENERLVDRAEKMGHYFLKRLRELSDHPLVGEARGKGLLVGLELVEDKTSKKPVDEKLVSRIVGEAFKQGVIIGKMNRCVPGFNNVIFSAPPLIISTGEIDLIVKAIKRALLTVHP